MSKFITNLNIDVQAVLEMLPKGSNVESIKLAENKRSVAIHWDNDNLRTPYTVPVAFPLENLSGDLPNGVTRRERPKTTTQEKGSIQTTESPKSTVDKPARRRKMLHVT